MTDSTLKPPMIAASDKGELRKFGLGFAALLALFFWALLPWWIGYERSLWPIYAGGVIAALAFVLPITIYPLFRVWIVIALILGWINTRLILGVVFFLLIMPLGGWLYWRGKLHFKQGFDPKRESYKERRKALDEKQMENPF
ncbi:SxtJ family membrane protein [Corallincola platygyrae]|uniref:SxtJ family membrane protein n=1 Tax=Corallincola platygyrae TaxID=1193278 RepID=A0ABW4XJK0_9GAMM